MEKDKPIFVTQPFLPPLMEFIPYLEKIWENKVLTNNGPFHRDLEAALCEYLGVEYLSLFSNGTLALITALQALDIKGEVITTPYSFVATANSIIWNNLTPIFVDIDPKTCNINPDSILEAITPKTTAILPVHCYGNPCDVERIQRIANSNGLKVIYDAAHAFGVKFKSESILKYGDLSVLSFHATKVFNTFEGGAIVCPNAETKKKVDFLKNFGFADEVTVITPGINGKMSEINAAFGLLQLRYMNDVIQERNSLENSYRKGLSNVRGISLFARPIDTQGNSSYFPLMVNENHVLGRDKLYYLLKAAGINGRRYFYPLITNFTAYQDIAVSKHKLQNAIEVSNAIICLPIYPGLGAKRQEEIIDFIKANS